MLNWHCAILLRLEILAKDAISSGVSSLPLHILGFPKPFILNKCPNWTKGNVKAKGNGIQAGHMGKQVYKEEYLWLTGAKMHM